MIYTLNPGAFIALLLVVLVGLILAIINNYRVRPSPFIDDVDWLRNSMVIMIVGIVLFDFLYFVVYLS